MLIPTPRLYWLFALGIPIAALGSQIGMFWVGLLYDALLLLVAWMTSFDVYSKKNLSVTRSFDAALSVRVQNQIKVQIENLGTRSIRFRFRDEPPPHFEATNHEFVVSLRPGGYTERTYNVKPRFRGTDAFRGCFLRITCPLGLVLRQERLPISDPVRVYPNVKALSEFSLLRQQGRLREIGIRRSRVRGLGTEFESLRDYTEGDDYRKIDWNATARRGKLIVRVDEAERNQAVIICIDAGRRMLGEINGVTKLDYALDASLMLAQAARAAGDQVGLLIYADRVVRYLPPRKGKAQLGAVIEALHDIAVLPIASNATAAFSYLVSRWKRRSLVVVFSDCAEGGAASDLLTAIGPLERHHVVVRVQVNDPRFAEVLKQPLGNIDDLYSRAAGLFLQSEMNDVNARFANARIATVESEPQNLAASLVSYYYEVKEKAKI